MDIGDFGEATKKAVVCREVVACDHVGINYLCMPDTQNFFLRGPGYLVFEEEKVKVVCPQCLIKADDYRSRSRLHQ